MRNVTNGQHGIFYWVEFSASTIELSELIKKFPDIFIQKYLAIVCFDSDSLKLTEEERLIGWTEKNEIAYSPLLTKQIIMNLPREQYDQWCLFKEPREFGQMSDFVNYASFSLITPENTSLEKASRSNALSEGILQKFWKELTEIDPFNFIADGDNFVFISKDSRQPELLIKYCM